MMLRLLSNRELALKWGEIKPEVDKALVYGNGDIEAHDLLMEALNGIAQCWHYKDSEHESYAMSRILTYYHYKELVIVTTSGEGWFNYGPYCLNEIEKFAKELGCKYVSIYGRKGWEKALPTEYKQPYRIYMKEI